MILKKGMEATISAVSIDIHPPAMMRHDFANYMEAITDTKAI